MYICIYINVENVNGRAKMRFDGYCSTVQGLLDWCEVHTTNSVVYLYIHTRIYYGVATISRLLKIIGLFCKRALQKRRYSAKETYDFKD